MIQQWPHTLLEKPVCSMPFTFPVTYESVSLETMFFMVQQTSFWSDNVIVAVDAVPMEGRYRGLTMNAPFSNGYKII